MVEGYALSRPFSATKVSAANNLQTCGYLYPDTRVEAFGGVVQGYRRREPYLRRGPGITVEFAAREVVNANISLAETRRVVSWMSEHPTARRICALLVADLIFSGLIFSIGSAVVLSIVFGLVSLFQYIFSETRPDFLQFRQGLAWLFDVSTLLGVSDYAIHKQLRAPINVYFYTTFTSSILIWIYAVSSFLLRVVRKVDFSRRFATKLDIEKKPLRCIGVAVIVFTTLCFLVAPFLR